MKISSFTSVIFVSYLVLNATETNKKKLLLEFHMYFFFVFPKPRAIFYTYLQFANCNESFILCCVK